MNRENDILRLMQGDCGWFVAQKVRMSSTDTWSSAFFWQQVSKTYVRKGMAERALRAMEATA